VCSPSPLRSFLILLNDAPVGMVVFRKDGKRGLHRVCECQATSLQRMTPRTYFCCLARRAPGHRQRRSRRMTGPQPKSPRKWSSSAQRDQKWRVSLASGYVLLLECAQHVSECERVTLCFGEC
jgi:hypothetical protein